ncbi:MAG: hypothetical protein IPJ34_37380 [Myxococcales bacterium]|nr:hypothetical protein [Myxococcales bacterium]
MRTLVLAALLVSCRGPVAPSPAPESTPTPSTSVSTKARSPVETKTWLCGCHHASGMLGSCDEMGFDDPDPDCLRTYADCSHVLACLRGEPGVGPKCLPGFRNAGAISRCARVCRKASDCRADEACTEDWGPPAVCWPK